MADHIIARLRRTSSIKISRQQSYVVNIKDTTCQAPTQRQYCDLSLKGRLWNLEKIQEAKSKSCTQQCLPIVLHRRISFNASLCFLRPTYTEPFLSPCLCLCRCSTLEGPSILCCSAELITTDPLSSYSNPKPPVKPSYADCSLS